MGITHYFVSLQIRLSRFRIYIVIRLLNRKKSLHLIESLYKIRQRAWIRAFVMTQLESFEFSSNIQQHSLTANTPEGKLYDNASNYRPIHSVFPPWRVFAIFDATNKNSSLVLSVFAFVQWLIALRYVCHAANASELNNASRMSNYMTTAVVNITNCTKLHSSCAACLQANI